MRASEFLSEAKGKIHNHHASVQRGVSKGRDPGGYYPTYHQYRTGLAVAMADGSDKKIDMDEESWMGPHWTQHPYTELEQKMLKQVRKTIPTEHHEIQPWSKSSEPDDTHRISPVTGFKGYK
jgi:hypothetical protein